MATPHNEAKKGEIAKVVLMPGDPLRAKYIAETFLTNPKLVNKVRGMFCYTGTYKGHELSVMGHGMGMASISIYATELFKFYDVDTIIRVGSCGSYSTDLKLFDTFLVTSAFSESNICKIYSGYNEMITYPSKKIVEKLEESAKELNIKIVEGRCISEDIFYHKSDEEKDGKKFWEILRDEKSILAVEMECFVLFHLAQEFGKNAGCLLTVSDLFYGDKKLISSEERLLGFNNMINIALNAAIKL